MKRPSPRPLLTPHLIVRDVARAARWYEQALGFRIRILLPGGRNGAIRHAEIERGEAVLMLGPESPERDLLAPISRDHAPSVSLFLSVEGVDEAHAHALNQSAHELLAPSEQFFGARTSVIADPDGHQWMLAEQRQEMSEGEMRSALRERTPNVAQGHAAAHQLRRPRTPVHR